MTFARGDVFVCARGWGEGGGSASQIIQGPIAFLFIES